MKIEIGNTVYEFPYGGPLYLLEPDEREMLNEYEKATDIIDKINSNPNFNSRLEFRYRENKITYTAEEVRNLGAIYHSEGEDAILP